VTDQGNSSDGSAWGLAHDSLSVLTRQKACATAAGACARQLRINLTVAIRLLVPAQGFGKAKS
jgi:hypothetical protein